MTLSTEQEKSFTDWLSDTRKWIKNSELGKHTACPPIPGFMSGRLLGERRGTARNK